MKLQEKEFDNKLEIYISGINRPKLEVYRGVSIDNEDIEVLCDDKVIQYETIKSDSGVMVTAALPKGGKLICIKIKAQSDGRTLYSKEITNSFVKRVANKVNCMVRPYLLKARKLGVFIKRSIAFMWREHKFLVPPSLCGRYIKATIRYFKMPSFLHPMVKREYLFWLKNNNREKNWQAFTYEPLISIIIPVYNIGEKFLSECLDSVLNQQYQNFEICIADDCSTKEETINTLKKYEQLDKRVRVVYREQNGHISKASNSALEIAKGEFCALLDNDDVLTKDALYEVVKVLNADKTVDFVYSDEDKLDLDGQRCEPHFKPDFSPDTLLSNNYICHFTVIRTEKIKSVGGFATGVEGAQDYDLFLKVTENTKKIAHIPKILYHWRKVEGSTSMAISEKSYAVDRGKLAVENALKRRGISAIVEKETISNHFKINYLYEKEPSITIVIPTRDHSKTLETCLDSLYSRTSYKNYEVIVVDNGSEEQSSFDLFEKYKKEHSNFKVMRIEMEFNYAFLNNRAVEEANGEYIMLLNNDTEIISTNWLERMVGYAMQNHVGAVGAKLYYPDMTVQHAGVILGLGVASHAYVNARKKEIGLYGRLKVPYNYAAVTAACLMVSKKKYWEVNGLNEELKVAYNDVDFNLELLEKGYYNICLQQVELKHYESKSRGLDESGEKYERFVWEQEFMYKKWGDLIKKDPFYNINLSKNMAFFLSEETPEERALRG